MNTRVYRVVLGGEQSVCVFAVATSRHYLSVNATVPAQSSATHSLVHDQLSLLSALHDISTSPAATPPQAQYNTLCTYYSIYYLNKCIGDDTKATTHQSINCIKKQKNKIWQRTILNMPETTTTNVARS